MPFPNSPSNGQLATVNNLVYVYNSTKGVWNKANVAAPLITNSISIAGDINTSGNLGITGRAILGSGTTSNVVIAATTMSASTTTGALVVNGGAGISGNIIVGGNIGIGIAPFRASLHSRYDAPASVGYTGNVKFQTTDQVISLRTYWESGVGQHGTIAAENGAGTTPTKLRFSGDNIELLTGSASTLRAVVDSGGNVVIGANSTTARFEVVGASGALTNCIVRSSDANMSRLTLSNTNRNWTISNYGTQFSPNSSLSIADETAGAVRFQIDSSGRVRTPNQVYFMGRPANDYSGGSMPASTAMPTTAIINNGSHFDSGTNRFTAPIAAFYKITWGGLQLPSTVTSVMINGTRTYNGNHYPAASPNYITMTQTAILSLNANDYITIEQWNGGGYYRDWYLWSVELIG